MKILQVNKFYHQKGGSDKVFFDTIELLKNKGHVVSVFSMKDEKNLLSNCTRHFVSNVDYNDNRFKNVLKSSVNFLYSFEAKNKLEQLLKEEKPDVAHLHNIYHQLSPSIIHALKRRKIPIVMTLHDYKLVCASYSMFKNGKPCEACKDGKYYNCFLQKCVKSSKLKSLLSTFEMYLHHKILHIYDLVDIFISPSIFLKEKLREMGFKNKIIYLPNFIDLKEYQPQYACKGNAIIYFGRLSKEKGLLSLIEAVKGINIKLKIIGEGPLKKDLLRKIKTESINNVELLGYKNSGELKKEVQNSMFVVTPSECYENNPCSIIEAFALGKPVVGTNIGGIPELIMNGKTGFTFEIKNEDDLKQKLIFLIKNPEKISEMGKNTRMLAEKKLGSESHYNKLIEIYDTAIKARS